MISVQSATIDSLAARFNLHPAVIKVDAEGTEWLVFSGAGNPRARSTGDI